MHLQSQQKLFVEFVDCDFASCGSQGLFILHSHMAHVIMNKKFTFQKDSDHLKTTQKVLNWSKLTLG